VFIRLFNFDPLDGTEKVRRKKKMLDQLIETKNNLNNGKRRGKFLFTTFVLISTLFFNGILWSLFAKDLGVGNENLELSMIVAPVPIPETAPPLPEPIKKVENQSQNQSVTIANRQQNIARIDEPQDVPEKIATVGSQQKARPNGTFTISNAPESDPSGSQIGSGERGNGSATQTRISNQSQEETANTEEPPQPKKKIVETPAPKLPVKTTVSKGVINGSALNLPKPTYPAAARAIHASGDVNVQVTIDESGNVISANAVSGHPLLKQVSEAAARSAKFKPTLLSDQPVKVTGLSSNQKKDKCYNLSFFIF
jgi:periplasmic protein TonB